MMRTREREGRSGDKIRKKNLNGRERVEIREEENLTMESKIRRGEENMKE